MSTKELPHVSIVLPAYNVASYVGATLASALGQTIRDLEVIVDDDRSTDETARIVADIADPRLGLVGQENVGVAAARNRGLREAGGQLVMFLDADDLLRPDAIARLHDALPWRFARCRRRL